MLKAKKAETILEEGVALLGRVVDDQGRPLAGAKVGLGADRQIMQSGFPSALDGCRRPLPVRSRACRHADRDRPGARPRSGAGRSDRRRKE